MKDSFMNGLNKSESWHSSTIIKKAASKEAA